MGRNSEYKTELKLEIINSYKRGKSAAELANEYDITRDMIHKWHNKYEAMGEAAFEHTPKNNRYSKELKIAAIKEYLNGEGSPEQITNKYKISSISVFRKWLSKYNSHIEIKDYDPKPEVYMAKSRKTTLVERIEIVEYCISNNKNYRAAAIKHGVNYAQVYTWTKEYLEFGREGLEDKRGRKKSESELTEVEKLKLEVKKLEARNKYLEMESEVLKKAEEIESEMIRGNYKKRNTKQ
jgi:transposase-like protein